MFSYILIALYAVPLLLCIMRGDADAVSSLMTGADEAVRFCISAAGGLCFWCAVWSNNKSMRTLGRKSPVQLLGEKLNSVDGAVFECLFPFATLHSKGVQKHCALP